MQARRRSSRRRRARFGRKLLKNRPVTAGERNVPAEMSPGRCHGHRLVGHSRKPAPQRTALLMTTFREDHDDRRLLLAVSARHCIGLSRPAGQRECPGSILYGRTAACWPTADGLSHRIFSTPGPISWRLPGPPPRVGVRLVQADLGELSFTNLKNMGTACRQLDAPIGDALTVNPDGPLLDHAKSV